MRLKVRPDAGLAQLTLSDEDETKNFLFALPLAASLAAKGAKALLPTAANLVKNIAGNYAGEVGEAYLEEEEGVEGDLSQFDWDVELHDTYDLDEPERMKFGVSHDGKTIQMALPYMDLTGHERVFNAIESAVRDAGFDLHPGYGWNDQIEMVGDVEVKNFLPALAGLASTVLTKIPIVGKLLGGLFGKKKKKKKKMMMQAAPSPAAAPLPPTEEEKEEAERKRRARARAEEEEELRHKQRMQALTASGQAQPTFTPAQSYGGVPFVMNQQTGQMVPVSALPHGSTVVPAGATPPIIPTGVNPQTGVYRDPEGNVKFVRTDLSDYEAARLGDAWGFTPDSRTWTRAYDNGFGALDASALVHDQSF